MDPILATALESGATVVAANHHVALSVAEWFSTRQAERGAVSWETPDVVAWDAWLERLWREQCWHGPERPLPLTASQEQYLWEQIIGAGAELLLHTPAAAHSAREAWRLLHEWRLETLRPEVGSPGVSAESRAFGDWSRFAGVV